MREQLQLFWDICEQILDIKCMPSFTLAGVLIQLRTSSSTHHTLTCSGLSLVGRQKETFLNKRARACSNYSVYVRLPASFIIGPPNNNPWLRLPHLPHVPVLQNVLVNCKPSDLVLSLLEASAWVRHAWFTQPGMCVCVLQHTSFQRFSSISGPQMFSVRRHRAHSELRAGFLCSLGILPVYRAIDTPRAFCTPIHRVVTYATATQINGHLFSLMIFSRLVCRTIRRGMYHRILLGTVAFAGL